MSAWRNESNRQHYILAPFNRSAFSVWEARESHPAISPRWTGTGPMLSGCILDVTLSGRSTRLALWLFQKPDEPAKVLAN
jgi:hypothetical protein